MSNRYIQELKAHKEELRQKAHAKGMSDLEFEQIYRDAAASKREARSGKDVPSPAAGEGASKDSSSK